MNNRPPPPKFTGTDDRTGCTWLSSKIESLQNQPILLGAITGCAGSRRSECEELDSQEYAHF